MRGSHQRSKALFVYLAHESVGLHYPLCVVCDHEGKRWPLKLVQYGTGSDPDNLRLAHTQCIKRMNLRGFPEPIRLPEPQLLKGAPLGVARVLVQRRDTNENGYLLCAFCKHAIDLELPRKSKWGFTIDHMDGNPYNNTHDNLQAAHLRCNVSNRKRTPPASREADARAGKKGRSSRHRSTASRPSGEYASRIRVNGYRHRQGHNRPSEDDVFSDWHMPPQQHSRWLSRSMNKDIEVCFRASVPEEGILQHHLVNLARLTPFRPSKQKVLEELDKWSEPFSPLTFLKREKDEHGQWWVYPR